MIMQMRYCKAATIERKYSSIYTLFTLSQQNSLLFKTDFPTGSEVLFMTPPRTEPE